MVEHVNVENNTVILNNTHHLSNSSVSPIVMVSLDNCDVENGSASWIQLCSLTIFYEHCMHSFPPLAAALFFKRTFLDIFINGYNGPLSTYIRTVVSFHNIQTSQTI